MSISTIQEKLLNKGCGTAFIVMATVAMGFSFVSGQCNRAETMNERGEVAGGVVGSVDGFPISAERIRAEADARGGQGQGALAQADALVQATGAVTRNAAINALLAKGSAVNVTEVEKAAQSMVAMQIDRVKMQLAMQGKLKMDATDADVEKALKDQLGGKTLAHFRSSLVSDIKTKFNDPQTKAGILDSLGGAILAARLGDKSVGSDEALRESYKTYVVKRIFFSAQSGSKETPEARAAKAEADLKAGTTFDKLMDTVSNDPAPAGKAAHDSTETLPAALFERRPELATLKGKPILATTSVVDVPGGKAIFQLVSTQDGTPPDFDKNKAKYRNEKALSAGQAELEKAVKELAKSTKWESKGYEALAIAAEAQRDTTVAAKAVEAAKAAIKLENPAEKRFGAMALLVATSPMGAPLDSAKRADRVAALEAAQAAGMQDAAISMELADLYAEMKDGAKTTTALLAASKNNLRYDAEGQRVFGDIAAKSLKLQGAKVISGEQLKEIQTQQSAWSAAKADYDKAAVGAKTSTVASEAANAAEIARQKAEAAKGSAAPAKGTDKANEAEIARQKAEAAKNAPKPSTTGGQ